MQPCLLDTDTLSEVMKGRDASVRAHASEYLAAYGQFTFSIITRYEILRGLNARGASRQMTVFNEQCRKSNVLPLSDAVIERASELYGELYRQGQLISDADILIAATAQIHHLTLITGNVRHFGRILQLGIETWHSDLT